MSIDVHGVWTATDKAGNHRAGQLTADQIAAVRVLAIDSQLAVEARRSQPPTSCRDAFTYAVAIGATRVNYTDCPGDPGQPTATIALVKWLQQSTM